MSDPFQHISPEYKALFDLLSLSALLGSLVELLPAVAALLTIVWTAIRILETDTVRSLLKRDKPDE